MTWEMLYAIIVVIGVVIIAYNFYRFKNGMTEEHRCKMEKNMGKIWRTRILLRLIDYKNYLSWFIVFAYCLCLL